jgi:guanylate kinase
MSIDNKEVQKKIIVIVGASGSGKTTLGNYLISLGVPELISNTTREKRPGEEEGITYHYVTKEEIVKMDMIERSQYDGQAMYGLSKEEVEEKLSKNDIVFFIADINGAFSVRKHYPKETLIVYLDTTIEDMKKHMKMRGDSDESIERRINFAVNSKELENGKFADIIINNGRLDECRIQFSKIILALRMGNL